MPPPGSGSPARPDTASPRPNAASPPPPCRTGRTPRRAVPRSHRSMRREEPISTAVTESPVQWLLHRRMNVQQQMRWTPRGAHLMLKVRCAVMNGTFEHDHTAAEQRARRPSGAWHDPPDLRRFQALSSRNSEPDLYKQTLSHFIPVPYGRRRGPYIITSGSYETATSHHHSKRCR
jgi:hypothetical protein